MRAVSMVVRVVMLLSIASCGATTTPGFKVCTAATQCDDGVFCNGAERCAPEDPFASAQGCVRGPAACGAGQVCGEAARQCTGTCTTDADGDGHVAATCGGDDCDDADATRYPGATELCNARDEDCTDTTFGDEDDDGDGAIDARCCNGTACGSDCDDAAPGVNPGSPEVCNGIDDNCNGAVDEGLTQALYPDADLDGFGAAGSASQARCPMAGLSPVATDCDDTNPQLLPGSIRCGMNPQLPAAYELCSATGVWTAGSCAPRICVTQPGGFGICTPP
jgi:hypothetical protein